MNLKKWANIPPKKQKAIVIKWASKAGPQESPMALYRKLAQQAAKSLKKNLKGKPYVTDVQIDCGEWYHFKSQCRSCNELVINVCTTDSNPPRLDLPATFKSFRVCQFDYGPKRDAYLKTWKRLFKELKGWNEEQTLTWVARYNYIDALEGGFLADPVYSHGPISTATAALIDKPAIIGDRYMDLYNEIRTMIWEVGNRCDPSVETQNHPDTIANYDWEDARNRFNRIVEKYKSPHAPSTIDAHAQFQLNPNKEGKQKRMPKKSTVKNYLLLFRGGLAPEEMTPEQMKTTRDNWMNWMGQLKKNKQLGAGHPLEDGGKMLSGFKGKNVAAFDDDKDAIGGFMIINAKNMAEATKLAKGCPIYNNGGTVELRQAAEMSD